jgi:bifunctional non-homologous end joining protein LigD
VTKTDSFQARFIKPMLLLRTECLPEGDKWSYELKLDGYRAIAFKANGRVHLRPPNDNDFTTRYAGITNALAGLANETVVDGELVAFEESVRIPLKAITVPPEGRKVIGLPAESRSASVRNGDRLRGGMAIGIERIRHSVGILPKSSGSYRCM